jgi:hypothetical protein
MGGNAGTGGSAGKGNSDPVPVDELGDAYETVLCQVLIECEEAPYRDLAHCKGDVVPNGLDDVLAGIEEGRVRYDAAEVGRCRAAIEENLCLFGDLFLFVPDVAEVLELCLGSVGTGAAGESCRNHLECGAGMHCSMQDYACPGVCAPYRQLGESCTIGSETECDPGTELTLVEIFELVNTNPEEIERLEEQELDCAEYVCRLPAMVGQACVSGQSCIDGWCDDAGTGLCQALGGVGAPCDFEGCAEDLWCDQPSAAAGTCREHSTSGGPCRFDSDCVEGFWCQAVGVESSQCTALSAAGGPCDGSNSCREGLGCNASSCVALPGPGEACLPGDYCAEGSECQDLICAELRFPGEPCGTPDAICSRAVCRSSVCELAAELGEACSVGDDCASNDCVGGICVDGGLCEYSNL